MACVPFPQTVISPIDLTFQAGTRRLVRTIPCGWSDRRLLYRHVSRSHLPNCDEPLGAYPPTLAVDRMYRLDCWPGSGGICCRAVHHGRDSLEQRHSSFTASVRHSRPLLVEDLSLTELLPWYRMVAMMAFMFCLWVVVPNKPRQLA